ncbi:MAG: hypothetical protein K0U52_07980, partial [Gammaproteobacteria bacterium]|nr:hypothetical protein [Gammaproteobacteria bacterium]
AEKFLKQEREHLRPASDYPIVAVSTCTCVIIITISGNNFQCIGDIWRWVGDSQPMNPLAHLKVSHCLEQA